MNTFRFPTLFLSHGTPMLAFGEDRYQSMLHRLGESLPRPKAVVIVSAHSVSDDMVHILSTEKNWIQHDFAGFPKALYEIQYQCPGHPELANTLAGILSEKGFKVAMDTNAPLDHGVWVPLLHLYPKGDVPVVRISLPLNLQPAEILKLGHSLASLREQGVMLIGSGGAVHNLRELKWSEKSSEGADWAQQIETFLIANLERKNVEAFLHMEEHPHFLKAHPTTEHFLPMLFTIGGTLPKDEVEILFKGIEYGSLSMLCFSLNHVENQALH